MPLDSSAVGTAIGPATRAVDARWAMEYAAALGDDLDVYLDTTRPEGILAHPVFPVTVEWAVSHEGPLPGLASLRADEGRLGVHYDQDILLHRGLRAGDEVSLTAVLAAVEQRRSGALHVLRFDARSEQGTPLWTSVQRSLFRGVEIEGGDRRTGDLPEPPGRIDDATPLHETIVPVTRLTPQVYTAASRIWNPIHTDEAVARSAGLPGIILHGTATLALAVSRLLDHQAPGRPELVRRIYGRFAATVPLPNELRVRVLAVEGGRDRSSVRFDVRTVEDQPAIRDGLLEFGAPEDRR